MKHKGYSGQSQLLIPLIIILTSVVAFAANTTLVINSTVNGSNTTPIGSFIGIPEAIEESFPIEVFANTSIKLDLGDTLVRATLFLDNGDLLRNKQIDFYLNDTILGSGLTNIEGFVDFPISEKGALKAVFNGGDFLNPSQTEIDMLYEQNISENITENMTLNETEMNATENVTEELNITNITKAGADSLYLGQGTTLWCEADEGVNITFRIESNVLSAFYNKMTKRHEYVYIPEKKGKIKAYCTNGNSSEEFEFEVKDKVKNIYKNLGEEEKIKYEKDKKSVTLLYKPKIDMSYTKKSSFHFSKDHFKLVYEGEFLEIKPLLLIKDKDGEAEMDLSELDFEYFVREEDEKRKWDLKIFNIPKGCFEVEAIAFDLTGAERYDEYGFKWKDVFIDFSDLANDFELVVLNDSRIVVENIRNKIINNSIYLDPTDQIFPSSTHKAYKTDTQGTTTDSPSQATIEFTSGDYSNIDDQNNVYVNTNSLETIQDNCNDNPDRGTCTCSSGPPCISGDECFVSESCAQPACTALTQTTTTSSCNSCQYNALACCPFDCVDNCGCTNCGTCNYRCNAGYYDADGNDGTGCEASTPSWKFAFQRYTFNLSSYDFNGVENITFCWEGKHNSTAGNNQNSSSNLLWYNVSAGSWTSWQTLTYDTENIFCIKFDSSNKSDIYNSTSYLVQFAARGNQSKTAYELNLRADFANLTLDYHNLYIVNQQSFRNWTAASLNGYEINATANETEEGPSPISNCTVFHRREYDNLWWKEENSKLGIFESSNGNCTTNITTNDQNQIIWSNDISSTYANKKSINVNETDGVVYLVDNNSVVYKINATNGTLIISNDVSTLTHAKGLSQDANFLYFWAANSTNYSLISVNKTNLQLNQTKLFQFSDVFDYGATTNDDDFVYIGEKATLDTIAKVNKSNFSDVEWTCTFGICGIGIGDNVFDLDNNKSSDWLYVCFPNEINRLNKSDPEPPDWQNNAVNCRALVLDTYDGDLWVGNAAYNLSLINETDGSMIDSYDYGSGTIWDISVDDDFVYLFVNNGDLLKVNKSDLSDIEWNFTILNQNWYGGGLDSNYVYTYDYNDGEVLKLYKDNTNYTVYEKICTKIEFNDTYGQTEETTVDCNYMPDSVIPTYSKNTTNTTGANASCNFSLEWDDNYWLNNSGQWIFSTNNSGVWKNFSATSVFVPDITTNKGYNSSYSTTSNNPDVATNNLEDSDYNKVNVSDNSYLNFSSHSNGGGGFATNYTHYRWTFNLTEELPGYDINAISSICYRVEGKRTAGAGSAYVNTKNMSSGNWGDQILLGASESNKTKCYSSGSIIHVINSSHGFQIATTAFSYDEGGFPDSTNVSIDYIEVNVTMNNDTRILNFSTTPENSTYALTLNSTVGTVVAWCYYASDDSGNMNGTGCSAEANRFWLNTTDETPPTWYDNATSIASGSAYSYGQAYQFNVTWNDSLSSISTVFIEHNFTGGGPPSGNDTVTTSDGDVYYYDVSGLAAGTYVWRMYANDTSDNWNLTDQWVYTVSQASPTVTAWLNESQAEQNIEYGSGFNFTGGIDTGYAVTLYFDLNDTAFGNNFFSGPRPLYNSTSYTNNLSDWSIPNTTYNFTVHFDGDTNYTASSDTIIFHVHDTIYPTYSNPQINTTIAGEPANFTLEWSNVELAGYIFSTNNSGTWVNSSYVSFSGSTNTSWNVTTLNSTPGTVVAWCFYANDSWGNMNYTNCEDDSTYYYLKTGIGDTSVVPFYPNQRAICRDITGRIHFTWRYNNSAIMYANSTDGTTWTRKFINVSTGTNTTPSISCDGNSIYIAYINREESRIKVYKSTNNGGSFSLLGPDCNTFTYGFVTIEARGGNGNRIYMVYADGPENTAGSNVLFVNSTDGGNTWGACTSILIAWRTNPSMIVNGTGGSDDKIYLVVRDWGETNPIKFTNSTDAGENWYGGSSGIDIMTSVGGGMNNPTHPSITYYGDNLYVVAFTTNGGSGIWFTNSTDAGISWTTNYTINTTNSPIDNKYPVVTIGNDSYPIVFWETNSTNSNYDIVYRISNGTDWLPENNVYNITNDNVGNNYVNVKYSKSYGKLDFLWRGGTSCSSNYLCSIQYDSLTVDNANPRIINDQTFTNWTYNGYNISANASDPDGLDNITNCSLYHRREFDSLNWGFDSYNKTGIYDSSNGNCTTNISTSEQNQIVWSNDTSTTTISYHDIIANETEGYVYLVDNNAVVYKINASNGTVIESEDVSSNSNMKGLSQDEDFLYFGTGQQSFVKVNKTNLTNYTESGIVCPGFGSSTTNDDDWLYIACQTNGNLSKINKTDFTDIDWSIQLETGIANTVFDLDHNKSSDWLYECWKKNLTRINKTDGKVDWNASLDTKACYAIILDTYDGNIWAASNNDTLYKINETNGSVLNSTYFGTSGRTIFDIVVDDDFVYTFDDQGTIRKINKSDLSSVWNFTISTEDWYGADGDTNYLYTYDNTNGEVLKLTKSLGNYTANEKICSKIMFTDYDGATADTTVDCNVIPPDSTPPTWYDNATSVASGSDYSFSQAYQFNVTWNDSASISTVFIEHNFTGGSPGNDTVTTSDGDVYYYDVSGLAAGTYVWRMYANDTSDNWNLTDQWVYTVSQASPTVTAWLNESQAEQNIEYGSGFNFTGGIDTGYAVTLYFDLNDTAFGNNFFSGPRPLYNSTSYTNNLSDWSIPNTTYNFTVHFDGDTNYTASSDTIIFHVHDTVYPTYDPATNSTNTTEANRPCNFSLVWSNVDLAGYIFSTNNSGTWVNDSYVSFSGQTNTSWNVTTLNSTPGTVVAWCFYANDTSGNMNGTGCSIEANRFWLNTTANVSFLVTLPDDSVTQSSTTGTSTSDEDINATTGNDKEVDPCIRGTATCQNSVANFRVNNTGNVDENITMCINASLPSPTIVLFGTLSNDPTDNPQTIPACSVGVWIANSSLSVDASDEFWLWTNFTNAAYDDDTVRKLFINATEA